MTQAPANLLARILVGYETATKGSVRLDGVSVNTWGKIGYAITLVISAGYPTIRRRRINNITRYKVPDDEKLEQICNEFNLHEIFKSYKDNEYLVSEDFYDVPGGLKQRIALARTFYNTPNFIVLMNQQ